MKITTLLKTFGLSACLLSGTTLAATNITGAGSTFIYPVLSKWTTTYAKSSSVKINYQPIGSGGGIQQLTDKTVTFAASDMPLDISKLQKNQWTQFPMVTGGIVPVVNLKGIKDNQLSLNGQVLADIYMGKVKYWDNSEIKKLNKGVSLPHSLIVSVHRADGSGTTFNFTNYLSKISPAWKKQVGANTVVSWPSFGLGAKGNAGVAAQVMNTPNTIGYVEYDYALQNNMAMAKMVNSAGKTVAANLAGFASAAKNASWQANNGFNLILTNQPGAGSWPIVATTFILMPIKGVDAKTVQATLTFFKWAFTQGANTATKLDYVTMPQSVAQTIMAQWTKVYNFK